MAQIECPSCGKLNNDINDWCIKCKATLRRFRKTNIPVTPCKSCGRFNIGSFQYCTFCGKYMDNIEYPVPEESEEGSVLARFVKDMPSEEALFYAKENYLLNKDLYLKKIDEIEWQMRRYKELLLAEENEGQDIVAFALDKVIDTVKTKIQSFSDVQKYEEPGQATQEVKVRIPQQNKAEQAFDNDDKDIISLVKESIENKSRLLSEQQIPQKNDKKVLLPEEPKEPVQQQHEAYTAQKEQSAVNKQDNDISAQALQPEEIKERRQYRAAEQKYSAAGEKSAPRGACAAGQAQEEKPESFMSILKSVFAPNRVRILKNAVSLISKNNFPGDKIFCRIQPEILKRISIQKMPVFIKKNATPHQTALLIIYDVITDEFLLGKDYFTYGSHLSPEGKALFNIVYFVLRELLKNGYYSHNEYMEEMKKINDAIQNKG